MSANGHRDGHPSGEVLLAEVAVDSVAAPPAGSGLTFRSLFHWGDIRRTPFGLAPVVMVSLIGFAQTVDTFAFSFALPNIIREFHIGFKAILSIVSMISFLGIIAGIYMGYLSDRVRRLPIFLGGTIASGISAVATAGAHSTVAVGIPRVVDTGAERAIDAPQFSLLADYYPPEVRGRIYGLSQMATSFGNVLAPVLAAGLITGIGLRPAFVVLGLPIVILGAIGFLVLREPVRGYFERRAQGASDEVATREDEAPSFAEAWRTVWSIRTTRRMFVASVLLAIGTTPFFTLYQVFLSEVYGLSTAGRGAVSTVLILGGALGTFVGAAGVDALTKYRPERAITLFGVFGTVAAFGLLVVGFTPPLWVVVAGLTFFFFGVSLTGPALLAVISQVIPPSVRGVGLQVFLLSGLPASVFTAVFGLIEIRYGWGSAIFASIPVAILGAIVFGTAGAFFDVDRRSALAASLAANEWRQTKAAGQDKLLVCRDVTVHYDGVQVLFGVDFDVDEGEIIALLGTNGAGKSTLLRAISGTHEASGGAIVFDGRDITHMPPHEIARRGVTHVPGGRGVFPGLTVRDNLTLGRWLLPEGASLDDRLREIFEIFPVLSTRAGTLAGSLSGGEQQQLSLAQALMANPRLLIIDELSLGLAPAVVGELIQKVRDIHARGTTVVIVEQSVNVALELAQRAVFMEKGQVRFFGATSELIDRPDILRAVYVKGSAGTSATARREPSAGGRTARTVLDVAGVVKRYGGVAALDGVDLTVTEGAAVGLLGPNGSGKTTLFDVISGFQAPDEGTVAYDGVDVTTMPAEDRAARGLIRRFQDARLFPSLTVTETLLLALDQYEAVKTTLVNAAGLPSTRRAERRMARQAEELIELLQLGANRDKFVKELSTGLRRIVDLACTMARRPRLLLLDEPSTGIAQAEAEGLAPLLRRVQRETNCTLLIIEHDVPMLTRVVDDLVVMDQGRVLTRGEPDTVLEDERVISAYLGTSEAAVNRSGGTR